MSKRSIFRRLSATIAAVLVGVNLLTVSASAASSSVMVKGAASIGGVSVKTLVTGLRITGLKEPLGGKSFDDEAVVMTDEGVSWKIPVVWTDESGQMASRKESGKKYLPTFALYMPEGVAMAEGACRVEFPAFVGDIYGDRDTITVVNASNGITYLTTPEIASNGNNSSFVLFDVGAARLSLVPFTNTYIANRNFDWAALRWQKNCVPDTWAWIASQNPMLQTAAAIEQLINAQNDICKNAAAIHEWLDAQKAWQVQNETTAAVLAWLESQKGLEQNPALLPDQFRNSNYPGNIGWQWPADKWNIVPFPGCNDEQPRPADEGNIQPHPTDNGNNQQNPANNGKHQQEEVNLVEIHCTEGAIDTIGQENLNNLISVIRNVIEPQAVNLLATKFVSFATAIKKGEIGKQIGLYIYNSNVDGIDNEKNLQANAYVLVDAQNDKIQYFIGVDAGRFINEEGEYVFNDVSFNDLSCIMVHEMMHAFMYDYTLSGMVGMPNKDNQFPDWFVEGIATVAGGGYESQHMFYIIMRNGYRQDLDYTYDEYLKDYTDQDILSFFNGGITEVGNTRLSGESGLASNYVTGYLACLYLGSMAASQNGLNAKNDDGSYNADAIRSGIDNILTDLHAGKPLDVIIRDISGNSYSGIADFESKFLAGQQQDDTYVSLDSASLEFSLGYLNNLNGFSKEMSIKADYTTTISIGSVLLPFDTEERSLIKSEVPEGMPKQQAFTIINSQDYVDSTAVFQKNLASAGSYQTGSEGTDGGCMGMAAYVDNRFEMPGGFIMNDGFDIPGGVEMPDGVEISGDFETNDGYKTSGGFEILDRHEVYEPDPVKGLWEMPGMPSMEIVKRITGEDIPEQPVPAPDEITGEPVSDDTDNINDQSNGFDMLSEDFASENDLIQDAAWD